MTATSATGSYLVGTYCYILIGTYCPRTDFPKAILEVPKPPNEAAVLKLKVGVSPPPKTELGAAAC